MGVELAITVIASSVIWVSCFELFERVGARERLARVRTFRWVGGAMLVTGTLALLAMRLGDEHAATAFDLAGSARGMARPAAMLVEHLLDLLGTLGVLW